MKVSLQVGDFITIPNGCKAVIKDNKIVFEKEGKKSKKKNKKNKEKKDDKEKEEKFKDGDILAMTNSLDFHCPFIYKGTDKDGLHHFYAGVNTVRDIIVSDEVYRRWGNSPLRYATDEEKHLLFQLMEEHGLRWDAEKKCVEELRWRAKDGDLYFCVTQQGNLRVCPADGLSYDKRLHWFGNYFRTPEHCREAAKRIKETLRNYHEEIGE